MARVQYPYREKDVRAAGDLILRDILARSDGRLPATDAAFRRLCIKRYDVDVRRTTRLDSAQLVQDFQPNQFSNAYAGEWTIFYNPNASAVRRLRYLIHELAEFIAITDHPDLSSLLDQIPGSRVYHYHGGDDPLEVRHRVAKYVERMYLKWLMSQ